MNDENQKISEKGLAKLAIDPDLLARELAAQLAGDPLDEIELDKIDGNHGNSSKECDLALKWLQSGNEERLQGLRVPQKNHSTLQKVLLVHLFATKTISK